MIDCRLGITFVVAIRIVSRRWSSLIFFLDLIETAFTKFYLT